MSEMSCLLVKQMTFPANGAGYSVAMTAERLGAKVDRITPGAATVIGGLLLAVPPLAQDHLPVHISVIILVMAVGAALTGWSPIELSRRAKTAKESADQARIERDVFYTQVLGPMMARLKDLVEASPERLKESYTGFTTHVCGEAAGMVVPNDANPASVNYYRLKGRRSGHEYLESVNVTRTVRRTRIDQSTHEGKIIVDRTLLGEFDHCPDVRLAGPEQIDPDYDHKYRCYASVSVVLNNTVYGMLSANTTEEGVIPRTALPILEIFASALAVAESKLGEADPKVLSQ